MKTSIVIPVYNNEQSVEQCIRSIIDQTHKPDEVIVIDDGSIDQSLTIVRNLKSQISNLVVLHQKHKGPALARNLGAQKAKGDILVFVDADMSFDHYFLEKLTEPIRKKKSKGTFNKDEFVRNWENVWARCWNINQNLAPKRRVPVNYPNTAPVFRAILRKEFQRVGGFDDIGYTDDWTLSKKLGFQATVAPGAISYHVNPDTLAKVFIQARWIGKNEFLTGNVFRKFGNLMRYAICMSLVIGSIKSIRYQTMFFLPFKIIYDLGIVMSIIGSFLGEHKAK